MQKNRKNSWLRSQETRNPDTKKRTYNFKKFIIVIKHHHEEGFSLRLSLSFASLL